ncbi:MAG TPA: Ger(x)C family spore germination protein [Clostridiales bacterium]|nr:Ger(x)C family spore germination protein [Clostridiales bacterium]HPV02148.1 Ger(x)C family spore germination protein [Clostridiales bacterium]
MRRTDGFFRLGCCLLVLAISLTLSGCYDQREIDDMAYPLAVGLDVGHANILRMTLQLAAPLSIGGGGGGESGGGGGGGGGKPVSVITIDTPSIYSGLNMVNNVISKEINMSHAKVIVISRELAEKGIAKYIQAIMRGREFRPDMFIVVSNDPPDVYLKEVSSVLESNPAKYYELLLGKDFSSYYPESRISDFHHAIERDDIEPTAALSGINPKKSVEDIDRMEKFGEYYLDEGQKEAGNVPVVSELKNVAMGTAVFKGGKMVGTLNGIESVCFEMVTGKYSHSYWTIPDVYDGGNVIVLNVVQRKRPKTTVVMKDGRPHITVQLDLEGDYTSVQSTLEYEKYPEAVENKTIEVIRQNVMSFLRRTAEEFDSDICGFGRYMKGNFLTWDEWKKFDWPSHYRDSEFNVEVKFEIRRTGLLIRLMMPELSAVPDIAP